MKKLTAAILTILVVGLSMSNAAAKPATDPTGTDTTAYTTDTTDDPEPKHSFNYPVPEPATLLILTLGAIMIKRKR
jgi:hypothetical protein